MRTFLVFMLSLYFSAAIAATVRWPGPAPCAGTLTDCMNSSQDGDVIEMTSDAVINGGNGVAKIVSLRSAPGTRASIYGNGAIGIQIAPSSPWTFSVQDLTIQSVSITLIVQGTSAGRIDVSNTTFVDVAMGNQTQLNVVFDQPVNLRNTIVITGCRFFAPASVDQVFSTRISNQQSSSPLVDITGNTFLAQLSSLSTNFRHALDVVAMGGSSLSDWEIEMARNKVVGSTNAASSRYFSGFEVDAFTGSRLSANLHDNEFNLDGVTTGGGGAIIAGALGGEIVLRALNNTVVDAYTAIVLNRSGSGQMSAKIDNNLLLNGFRAIEASSVDSAAVTQRKNLVFGYINPSTILLAADTLLLNPLLGSAADLHLRPGSPAIDAGLDLARSELGPGTLPAPTALDAERYQRIQGSHVDIGALEGTRLFNDGLE
jgi:hypothetical protein